MRLRNRYLSDRIFEGGLASPEALPMELAEEFYEVGVRRGHYQGFLNLLAHERLWPRARDEAHGGDLGRGRDASRWRLCAFDAAARDTSLMATRWRAPSTRAVVDWFSAL